MYPKICILVVLIISSFFFSACNDEPTSSGLSILNNGDLIAVSPDSTYLTESGNYSSSLDFYGSEQVLLGRYNNVQSDMLAQFMVFRPDTIQSGLLNNSVTVSSAWIEMRPLYKIGGDTAGFNFSVFRINSGWPAGTKFNADSLAGSNFQYNAQNEVANLKITDTLYTVNLNPQSVLSWAKDTSKSVVPLYFRPNQSLSAMAGFRSYYSNSVGNPLLLKVVYEKQGAYKDTVFYPLSNNQHVMKGNRPVAQPDKIVLQGGVGERAWLKFDLSRIPAGAIINSAVLELTIDPATSVLGTSSSSSLYARLIKSNSNGAVAYDSTMAFLISRSGNVFSGDISPIVQKWNLGQPNNGVSLNIVNEKTTVDLLSFLGINGALRPKLRIVYTARPFAG